MSDLPRERLAFKEPPFLNTGINYCGPFFVSVKKSTEKRWGFLFTCLTTRAVHFEVVPSMDISSCVMGVERFCARREIPSVIWSDNGTNFVVSEKELLSNINYWNQQVFSESLAKKGIKWKFNYPLGRVVKLNYGTDAIARSAEVKASTRNLVRPVVKLAPVLPISD